MEIEKFIDVKQLQTDLAFSDADLESAMMLQASLFAHYGVIAAKASQQVDQAKMNMDIVEARLDKAIRDRAAVDGEKTTEKGITQEISRKSAFVEAQKTVSDAKMVDSLARSAMEAFRHKRDMLVQIGLISREEMKGEVSIKLAQANEAAREERLARIKEKYGKDTHPDG